MSEYPSEQARKLLDDVKVDWGDGDNHLDVDELGAYIAHVERIRDDNAEEAAHALRALDSACELIDDEWGTGVENIRAHHWARTERKEVSP